MARFKSIQCELSDNVGFLALDRPDKSNAMNTDMWEELPAGLAYLEAQGARAIVLHGLGRNFCAGIDLSVLGGDALGDGSAACEARARLTFLAFVGVLQRAMTACELCRCPVIAAIHGACWGAGVDLVTACDIRLSTLDAKFSVKEVDLGLASDMGTLARLPGIVGEGVARELALTCRIIDGNEAKGVNLVSQTFSTQEELMAGAVKLAQSLAAKSPLALAGTKRMLLEQRGRTVEEGLERVARWNAAMLPGSADIREIFAARAEGRAPRFSKL